MHGLMALPLLLCVAVALVFSTRLLILSSGAESASQSLLQATLGVFGCDPKDAKRVLSSYSSSAVLPTLALFHFALACVTILAATIFTAPYGRHASLSSQWTVSPFVSWVCQEVPTLLAVAAAVLPALVWWFPASHLVLGFVRGVGLELLASARPELLQSALKQLWNGALLDWLNPSLLTSGATVFYPSLLLFIIHYTHRTLVYPFFLSASPNRVPWYVTILACCYCAFNGVLQVMANTVGASNHAASRDVAFTRIVSAKGMATSLQSMAKATLLPNAGFGLSALLYGETIPQTLESVVYGLFGFGHIASRGWFVVGVCVFVVGMSVNVYCDYYILGLRKRANPPAQSSNAAGTTKSHYVIPSSIFHRLVSCPNFAAEVVEWCGYAIAVYGASGMLVPFLAALSFPVYTLCNLGPRAVQHHRWYVDQFGEEYRRLGRKALIPFVM